MLPKSNSFMNKVAGKVEFLEGTIYPKIYE
jgi:hypothetical protein